MKTIEGCPCPSWNRREDNSMIGGGALIGKESVGQEGGRSQSTYVAKLESILVMVFEVLP